MTVAVEKPPDGLIEFCDFESHPIGGQLTFARNFLKVFGSEVLYIGLGSRDDELGVWTEKTSAFCGTQFFFVGRVSGSNSRHLVPRRLNSLLQLLRCVFRLRKTKFRRLYVQSPEALFGALFLNKEEIVYRFSGINNPVLQSRYNWARPFARVFGWAFDCALRQTSEILVTSSKEDLEKIEERFKFASRVSRIGWLPTLYDPDIYFPNKLGLPKDKPRLVFVGRLNNVKGLDLILNSFADFVDIEASATLTLVGDGELVNDLQLLAQQLGIVSRVHFLGNQSQQAVAGLLRRHNIFVLGSHFEGWPTAVVEAAATGLYIVSTNLESVADIIDRHGFGGLVLNRSQAEYADALRVAWQCVTVSDRSGCGVSDLSLSTLRERLCRTQMKRVRK